MNTIKEQPAVDWEEEGGLNVERRKVKKRTKAELMQDVDYIKRKVVVKESDMGFMDFDNEEDDLLFKIL